jgi:SAM-dependent methyltransferase
LLPDQREIDVFPASHVSNPVDADIVQWLESQDGMTLNLGAGGSERQLANCIELEWSIFRHTDIVGDAHSLPFRDRTFSAIITYNTFEHLREPTVAARELWRVLAPGGQLVLKTAFLQPLHEGPHHYYNATEFGVRNWLRDFEIDELALSAGCSPALALGWLATEVLHYIGLHEGWATSERLAATTLGQWRQLWADPSFQHGVLWDAVERLPEEVRRQFAAAFRVRATKPRDARDA